MGNCNSQNQNGQDSGKGFTFNVKIPGGRINPKIIIGFVSLLISALVIFFSIKKINFVSVLAFFILAILIYILLTSLGSNVLSISLPSTTYPVPPHLGLDAVSPDNYNAGKNV